MFPILLAQTNPTTSPSPAGLPASDGRTVTEKLFDLDLLRITSSEWMYVGKISLMGAMFVLILMFLAWTVSAWISNLVRISLHRVKFDETLTKFISKFVRWTLLLMVALSCLSFFGVQTTSFAAVIGAAGLAIGLAFQGTLSNFAAGAMLLVFRPYKVGDVVNLAGNLGKVFEIELFTTAIDTFDNRRFIIPNSEIFGAVIENITYHPVRRVEVGVGTAYTADIDQTREVLAAAIETIPQVVKDPEPAVVLLGLGASSVDWSVRAWARGDDYGDVKQALIRAVKVELDRAGIEIPFPQMDVHVDPSASGLEAA